MNLVIFALLILTVKGWDSCQQGRCSCAGDIVSCYGVDNPFFNYRPLVKHLHMENVYISYVERLDKSFTNLELISLKNMQYINCEEVFSILDGVTVIGDYCHVKEPGEAFF